MFNGATMNEPSPEHPAARTPGKKRPHREGSGQPLLSAQVRPRDVSQGATSVGSRKDPHAAGLDTQERAPPAPDLLTREEGEDGQPPDLAEDRAPRQNLVGIWKMRHWDVLRHTRERREDR
jgi:hypothetical protein